LNLEKRIPMTEQQCAWCGRALDEYALRHELHLCRECREEDWGFEDMVDDDEEDFWDHEDTEIA
jgi:hypothetical protein